MRPYVNTYAKRYPEYLHGPVRFEAPGTADDRNAHRRRRAEDLLREGSLTVSQLAYRLGYEDAANFNRACQRWFGSSPGKPRCKA